MLQQRRVGAAEGAPHEAVGGLDAGCCGHKALLSEAPAHGGAMVLGPLGVKRDGGREGGCDERTLLHRRRCRVRGLTEPRLAHRFRHSGHGARGRHDHEMEADERTDGVACARVDVGNRLTSLPSHKRSPGRPNTRRSPTVAKVIGLPARGGGARDFT
jgi:hypothetical protein